jgi:hypothetical protein
MNRIFILLSLIFFCFSCSQTDNKTENQARPESGTSQADPVANPPGPVAEDLTPDLMTEVPEVRKGCTGLFTYDSVSLDNGSFVFVHNLEGKATLQIDGKTLALNQVEKTEPEPGQTQEIFSATHYKVILKTNKVKQNGSKEGEYKGTLDIYKDISHRNLKVHGKVSCK